MGEDTNSSQCLRLVFEMINALCNLFVLQELKLPSSPPPEVKALVKKTQVLTNSANAHTPNCVILMILMRLCNVTLHRLGL